MARKKEEISSEAGSAVRDGSPGRGDVSSLQQLVHAQSGRLLKYLERHTPAALRRVADPHDVLQDTLFEAFRRLPEFSPADPEAASRWLMTIARSRLVDAVRKHGAAKRGGQAAEETRHGSVIALLEDLAVYRRTPSRSAAAHELLRALQDSIERLNPDHADAVRLRYVEGFSLKETAGRMNRSEGAVQMLALRGLRELRLQMRSASLFI